MQVTEDLPVPIKISKRSKDYFNSVNISVLTEYRKTNIEEIKHKC